MNTSVASALDSMVHPKDSALAPRPGRRAFRRPLASVFALTGAVLAVAGCVDHDTAAPAAPVEDVAEESSAFAAGQGLLFAAKSNDTSNKLTFASSTDGASFRDPLAYGSILLQNSPALAQFNGRAYVAFKANDASNRLVVTSSVDGLNFLPGTGYSNITLQNSPAMAAFNGKLYIAFKANDTSNKLFITSSSDGVSFPTATGYSNITLQNSPAMAVFNNKLYVAYKSNDTTNKLCLVSSSDGGTFSAPDCKDHIRLENSPALAAFNGKLYVAFKANDTSNKLHVASAADGTSFPYATPYPSITLQNSPAMAVSGGKLHIGFKANDATNRLFVTSAADGASFPSATLVGNVAFEGSPALLSSDGAGPRPVKYTKITSKNSGPTMCLDAWGANSNEDAPVKQGTCNGGSNQKLGLVPAGDSYYNIVFEHSGKCLDIAGASTGNSAVAQQHTCHGGDNQKFKIVDNYDGYSWIVAKHSGKCLDIDNYSTANGAQIKQYTCHGGNNQKFKLDGRTFYNIKPVNSGLCLDIQGASVAPGATVMQGDCHGGDNQRFELEDKGNGYYQVVSKNSGLCLDVWGASTANAADVKQGDCTGADHQLFQKVPVSGSTAYGLKAKHSGLCLDVWNASTSNAAPIKQGNCHGGTNQQFTQDTAEPAVAQSSVVAVNEYQDFLMAAYRVATDPTVTYNLAKLASMLGFAWAGGTQYGTVGQGFDVSYAPGTKSYVLQAHYNASDPYASGYRANERLKITLSNFRTEIDASSFVYGTPVEGGHTPIQLDSYMAVNHSDYEDSVSKTFSKSTTTTTEHSTSTSLELGFSVSVEKTAKVPLVGEVTATTEFTFNHTDEWGSSESHEESFTAEDSYTAVVPPHSKRLLKMVATQIESSVAYTAYGKIVFDIEFSGFMSAGANALPSHTEDRPTVTLKFGTATVSGLQDILDQYARRNIPNASDYDWSWAAITYGQTMRNVIGFFRAGVGVPLTGRFDRVRGTDVHIIADAPLPL